MTGGKKHVAPGLTLIEILIVVALFATASVILSQTFLSFTRLHRKIANSAVLAEDMRYAMELMTRETRKKLINYDPASGYPDEVTAAASSILHLVDAQGNTRDIAARANPDCGDPTVTNCLALSDDGGATWNPITGTRINVKRFGVYVRPTKDPFAIDASGATLADEQPMATVHLELEYVAPDARDNTSLEAQTTVSSRIYKR